MDSRVLWTCLAASLLGWLSGCATEPPGEQIGVFDVEATLKDNTCGEGAVIAGDSRYAVELRRDREAAYWQFLGGQPLAGSFEADSFQIEIRTYIELYGPQSEAPLDDPLDFATLEPGVAAEPTPGCTLTQDEELRGTVAAKWLDAGIGDAGSAGDSPADAGDASKEADLVGEHVQVLTPVTGSDCGRALLSQGGIFRSLPCEIRYSLAATRRD